MNDHTAAMLARRARQGYAPEQSRALLEEILAAHDDTALVSALCYHGFATERQAEAFAATRQRVARPGDVVEFAGRTRVVEDVVDRGSQPSQDRYVIAFADGLTTTHPTAHLAP